jgi:prepilin-type N-terminal cleavage/methylation domain-containing protein
MKRSTEPPGLRADRRADTRADTRAGFTLLEVLAAVAILGIWFSVLASVAIQGQRAEGENERRIRASLIADRILMDVELAFEEGEFPDDAVDEFEEDDFLVRIEALPLTELVVEIEEGLIDLLETELTGIAQDLRAAQISVIWTEGHAEESVTRITYAYDITRLQEALAGTAGAPGAEAGDGPLDDGGLQEPES